ncbi:hypothetical protein [Kitasatospora sp. MBT66]|uniref:hypothetical protein n=1 Tax=Kitasatospora sp. MBT66 TaxID=1444769 RepID=UPI0005BE87E0|nr:hypothetical protein [Kitasatospora sp. MBT66]
MSTEQGGEQEAHLEGPGGDGLYGAYLLDWIAMCDDLQDGDTRGYWTLRALVYEHRGVINRIRVLTMADICQLIPGPNGKPSSLTRVRGMLSRLSTVGLMSTPEGGPIKTSSRPGALTKPLRIKIHDKPCNGYVPRWRNVDEKLKAIQPQAEQAAQQATEQAAAKAMEERAKRAGRNSDPESSEVPAGRNSDPGSRNSDPGSRNSDPQAAADQQEPDPFFFSGASPLSLLTPAAGGTEDSPVPAGTATDERESSASPQEPTGDGPAVSADQERSERAETVLAAYTTASGRPMVNGTRTALLAQIVEHLEAGYPVQWLADRVREMAEKGWLNLGEHVARSKVPVVERRPARPAGLPPVDPDRKKAPMPAHIAALRDSVRNQVPAVPAARPAPAPSVPSGGQAVAGKGIGALLADLASPNI